MKKILIMFIVILGLINSSYALDNSTNLNSHYKFENSSNICQDYSGNSNTCTNSGTINVSSNDGSGREFDDLGDYIVIDYVTSGDWTMNFWKYSTGQHYLFDSRITTNNNIIIFSNGKFCSNGGGTASNLCMNDQGTWHAWTSSSITNNVWEMVTFTYDSSTGVVEAFINGVSQGTITISTGKTIDTGGGLKSTYLTGLKVDEYTSFNTILSDSDILDLYNNGIEYGIVGDTPTINYNVTNNNYLNYQPSILLNTTTNTNMSYILNNGNETSICNNCNSTTFNPTLNYGKNNFTFISNDENGEINNTLTLIYDNVNPTLTENITSTLRSFEIDFNDTINATDNYLTYWEVLLNGSQIANSTNTTYTFNEISTFNLVINAYDLAGNINTTNHSILVSTFLQITGFGNTTGTPYQLSSVTWNISGVTQSANPFKDDLINYLNNSVNSTVINIQATDNAYLHRNYNENFTLNRTNYNINITLLPNQLTLNFEQDGVSSNVNGIIYDEDLFTANFSATPYIIIQDSLAIGDVKVEFNPIGSDSSFVQYYEYYNDKEDNHVEETLEILQTGDTWGYFKIVDNSENPIEGVIITAYTNYYTLDQTTTAKKIGQRLTTSLGRTFFNFDSGYITKFRIVKDGYTTKEVIYSLNDWSGSNKTEYTYDYPLIITLQENNNLVKDDTYLNINRFFNNETSTITGIITGLNKESVEITTKYRENLGYNNYEYTFNSEDQVIFTLTDGNDYDKSSTNDITIKIYVDGSLWNTYTIQHYEPTKVFDVTNLNPTIVGIAIIILSIIMGLIFKNIEAGTHTFFGASLFSVVFNEAFIGLAVVGILYYASDWIKTIVQESTSDTKKFFIFVTYLNIIINLSSTLAVDPTNVSYSSLLGLIGWLLSNFGAIAGISTIAVGFTAIVGTIKKFAGQEMTVGDAIVWGAVILFALTINPLSLTPDMVSTTLEKLLIWMLMLTRGLLMGVMVITGYILIKNKGA